MRGIVVVAAAFGVGVMSTGCRSGRLDGLRHGAFSDSSDSCLIHEAVSRTMNEARQAVDEDGLSTGSMDRICSALARLAKEPTLKDEYAMRTLHGGGASSVVLASEADDGLTLRLSKFEAGKTTPIHDHGCWAVAYVLEGEDEYTHWQRIDDGQNPDQAKLQVEYRRVLNPGDCVHWLDPPHDIHSQHAIGGTTWELVLFGRNHGRTPRHYFDPETGRIDKRMPQG